MAVPLYATVNELLDVRSCCKFYLQRVSSFVSELFTLFWLFWNTECTLISKTKPSMQLKLFVGKVDNKTSLFFQNAAKIHFDYVINASLQRHHEYSLLNIGARFWMPTQMGFQVWSLIVDFTWNKQKVHAEEGRQRATNCNTKHETDAILQLINLQHIY